MAELDVKLLGHRELLAAVKALPGALGEHVQGVGMRAAAKVVAQEMKATSRFVDRSGRLRQSIKAKSKSGVVDTPLGRKKVRNAAAQAGAYARHAHLIELGGGRLREARPFVYPALESTRLEQMEYASRAMRTAFGKIRADLAIGRSVRKSLQYLTR